MLASKKNLLVSQTRTATLEHSLPDNALKYQGFDAQFQRSFFVSMTLIALLTIAMPMAISTFTGGGQVLPRNSEVVR